jgi:lycopene cyclase domain-containing protein
MRYTYLIIDFFIVLVPALYSFDSRIRYYRCFSALGLSMVVVGIPYIAWDVLVTRWGEWSFNARYLTGVEVFNLPVEEILFFVTVPYSCLFIYESVAYYSENRPLRIPRALFFAIALVLLAASVLFSHHGYTLKAFTSGAIFLLGALLIKQEFIVSTRYWVWLGICYIPFLVVNAVLTALPVVEYNPRAILGPRVGSIPVEDFFYNFSMLSFYGLFYVFFKDWLRVRQGDKRPYNTAPGETALIAARRESRAAER